MSWKHNHTWIASALGMSPGWVSFSLRQFISLTAFVIVVADNELNMFLFLYFLIFCDVHCNFPEILIIFKLKDETCFQRKEI